MDQIVGEGRSGGPIGSGLARVSDVEAACEKKKKRKVGRVSACLICLFQDARFALLSLHCTHDVVHIICFEF
jgi:hypothetical protein